MMKTEGEEMQECGEEKGKLESEVRRVNIIKVLNMIGNQRG